MGVGELASELEDGLNEDVGENETVYHSAVETQTESADSETGGGEEGSATSSEESPEVENENENKMETSSGSNATNGVEEPEKEKGEEELGILDLLPVQPQPQPQPPTISGVESWELEVGETVKRTGSSSSGNSATIASGSIMSVGGTKTRTRPRKRELKVDEIGKKNGGMNGKPNEVDDLLEGGSKTTGVLDLASFAAPHSTVNATENDVVNDNELKMAVPLHDSAASASALTSISRQSALDERESSIAERESTLVVLESSLKVRESSIADRESLITKRESSITDRENSLDIRESTISERESTITARESALTADESEIQRRLEDIQRREVEVEKREIEVEKREQEVSEREMRVERREAEVEEWYQGKLAEIGKMLVDVPPPISVTAPSILASSWTCMAQSKWPPSPMEFARRLCTTFLLPVLGEERTPGFLLSSTSSDFSSSTTTTNPSTSTSSTTPPLTTTESPSVSFWSFKRDFFLKRLLGATAGRGSYIIFMSIGICVILLRGVVRKVLRVGGFWR
jgi:hypothetical protein